MALPRRMNLPSRAAGRQHQNSMSRKPHATAYHEAGHAFADWHFGFTVKRATIMPKGGTAGHVATTTRLHFRSLEYSNPSGARIGRLHERVVSLLAGHEAQRRYSPSSVRSYHARSDREKVADLLVTLHSKEELPHVLRYLQAKAANLVERPLHWRAIRHLAGLLVKHKTMTGEQVTEAILEAFQREHQRQPGTTGC